MSQTRSASDSRGALLASIRRKRTRVETYLQFAVSRRRLLLNVTLVAGALAASLTAAPALGGKSFADWLTSTFGLSSPAWQVLCAAAAACSLAATIATQLLKSHNLDEHVARAQAVRARLEALEVRIASGQIGDAEAAAEFMRCIDGVAFIGAPPRRPARA